MCARADRGAASNGYAMVALLVTLAIISVALGVAMPVWRTTVQRDREEELIFRGKQYTRAIGLYQRRFPNSYPPSFDVLVDLKFLRKKFKDPMAADGEFEVVRQGSALALAGAGRGSSAGAGSPGQSGSSSSFSMSLTRTDNGQGGTRISSNFANFPGAAGPVLGVVSKSTDPSIKLYDGRSHYNEWVFIYQAPQQPGRGGGMGQRGGRGGPGGGGGQDGGFGFPGRGMGPGRGGGGGNRGGGGGRGGRGDGGGDPGFPGGGRQQGGGRQGQNGPGRG